MIIPIRCFTCNCLLSCKYLKYLAMLKEGVDIQTIFKTLKIRRICCKTILQGHIDLLEKLN